jgi:predicted type IV restriction endonuclease
LHYFRTKFHEKLPSGSKDINTLFILKASNTRRTFLPYSKQLALVAMVTLDKDYVM